MTDVRQIIVMRKDLKMRRGKEMAQAAHSSIAFLSNKLRVLGATTKLEEDVHIGMVTLTEAEKNWIEGSFKKIVVGVDSEEELLEIHEKAQAAGLTSHLITDSGLTEFHGIATNTCIAIGPAESEQLDPITGGLKLL